MKDRNTLKLGDRVCLLGRSFPTKEGENLVGTVIEIRSYHVGIIRDRVLVRWDAGWEAECSENVLRALPRAIGVPS